MLVDLHGKMKALIFFISFVHLLYDMTNGIFISLFNFVSLFMFLLYLILCYKTLKMPAHWCIYKCMFYIYLIKYLYYISENKAMLIQLLVCHIYIYICNKKYR